MDMTEKMNELDDPDRPFQSAAEGAALADRHIALLETHHAGPLRGKSILQQTQDALSSEVIRFNPDGTTEPA
jgi:hypothetical protein